MPIPSHFEMSRLELRGQCRCGEYRRRRWQPFCWMQPASRGDQSACVWADHAKAIRVPLSPLL